MNKSMLVRLASAAFVILLLIGHESCAAKAEDSGLDPQAIVASRGGANITVELVQKKIASIPAEVRGALESDTEGFGRMIDSLLLTKQLAKAAVEEGVVVDGIPPGVIPSDISGLTEVSDAFMKLKLKDLDSAGQSASRYEALARERFLVNEAKYSSEKRLVLLLVEASTSNYGDIAAKIVMEGVRPKIVEAFEQGGDLSALTEALDHSAVDVKVIDLPRTELYEGDATGLLTRALYELKETNGVSSIQKGPGSYAVVALWDIIPPKRYAYEEVRDRIISDIKGEHLENRKTGILRSYSLLPVELNYDVIRKLMRLDQQSEAVDNSRN